MANIKVILHSYTVHSMASTKLQPTYTRRWQHSLHFLKPYPQTKLIISTCAFTSHVVYLYPDQCWPPLHLLDSFVLNTSDLRKDTSFSFSRPHLDNSRHVGTLTLIRPLIFPVLVKKLNLLTTFKSTLVTFLILDYCCLWTLMTDGFLQELRTAWDFFHVGKDSLLLNVLIFLSFCCPKLGWF